MTVRSEARLAISLRPTVPLVTSVLAAGALPGVAAAQPEDVHQQHHNIVIEVERGADADVDASGEGPPGDDGEAAPGEPSEAPGVANGEPTTAEAGGEDADGRAVEGERVGAAVDGAPPPGEAEAPTVGVSYGGSYPTEPPPGEAEARTGGGAGVEAEPAVSDAEDAPEDAPAEDEVPSPGEAIAEVDEVRFRLMGMLMFGYSVRPWRDTPAQQWANLVWNQARLAFDVSWGEWASFLEIRFWDFMWLVRQAWMQYTWDQNQVRLGLIQRPWGREAFSSESWWFAADWYVGLGDDYDLGVRYARETRSYRLDVAYMAADMTGFFNPSWRWGADLTPVGEQQNRQFSTGVVRWLSKFQHRDGMETQVGAFGSVGLLHNAATGKTGHRWYAGLTYTGNYDGWVPLAQVTRQEFHPNNPDTLNGVQVDDRVVRISQFAVVRDMAAKGWLVNVNLAKTFVFNRRYLQSIVPYFNYSAYLKDEASFEDTHLITPGLQVRMYAVWIWIDMVMARNMTFMNDSAEASGIGAGAIRRKRFEYRPNVQALFFF